MTITDPEARDLDEERDVDEIWEEELEAPEEALDAVEEAPEDTAEPDI